MRNQDRYKTAQERAEAFAKFCTKEYNKKCTNQKCIFRENHSSDECSFLWLDLEAEEERYHCIFCGKELKYRFDGESGGKLVCECGYEEPKYERVEESIAAHNRVVKKRMEVI